jgi:homoserine O-acetyltransferase/O-succinyltransferase
MNATLPHAAPPPPHRTAAPDRASLPAFEIIGPSGAPTIAILGGISATRHVASSAADRSPGWWEPLVGRGRTVDTSSTCVLGMDWLDGGDDGAGRPARLVSTHDQADALAALVGALDIGRLHAVIGASYGGMVALAFAERYPELARHVLVISAPHQTHPMATARRALQRAIVELGIDSGHPQRALALARGLAMTTYRSQGEFASRFDSAGQPAGAQSARFPVEDYLDHHGRTFATRWRTARYLALSLSADLHRVDPAAIRTPTTLVGAQDDEVVPRWQLEALRDGIAAPATLTEMTTRFGHDAFLLEHQQLSTILTAVIGTRS